MISLVFILPIIFIIIITGEMLVSLSAYAFVNNFTYKITSQYHLYTCLVDCSDSRWCHWCRFCDVADQPYSHYRNKGCWLCSRWRHSQLLSGRTSSRHVWLVLNIYSDIIAIFKAKHNMFYLLILFAMKMKAHQRRYLHLASSDALAALNVPSFMQCLPLVSKTTKFLKSTSQY